jgi:tetratricopeptide (TPR) repeat protein
MMLTALIAGMAYGAAPRAATTPAQLAAFKSYLAARNRAKVEWEAGKKDDAVRSMHEALTIAEKVVGHHRRTREALEWLADWERERGDWGKAARYLWRIAAIQAALWGERHWKAIDARWDAKTARIRAAWTAAQREEWEEAGRLVLEANRLRDRGEHARALPLNEKWVAVTRRLAGEGHPSHANALDSLALTLEFKGDYEPALTVYKRALAIRTMGLGEGHPDYARSLHHLASVRSTRMKDHQAALPLFKRVLAIRKEALGEGDHLYDLTLDYVVSLYKDMGDYKAALPLARRLVAIRKKEQENGYDACLGYADSLHGLGLLYARMGDHEAALPLLKRAQDIRKKALREK